MSQKANTKLIGLFVIIGFVLFIGIFALINKSLFLSNSSKNVLFFSGSVSGLNVGSPVLFNGVPVGRVVNISLIADVKDLDIQIPVYIEGDQQSFTVLNADGSMAEDNEFYMQKLIEKGLRAKLTPQSFLTGQMMIELGFYPGTPIVLHGNTKVPEIPTLPSTIEELSRTLQNLPIQQTFNNLDKLMTQMNELTATINKETPVILREAKEITHSLASTSAKADRALDSFSQDSKTMMTLDKTLKDFGYAALSLRNLTDYLERHPEALLRGKGGYKQ